MNKQTGNMFLWFAIVAIVVGGLIFITIKGDNSSVPNGAVGQEEETNNMQNGAEDGVKVVVLKEGTGTEAKAGDTVSMNYTGSLVDGTVFDSNVDPKFNHVEPFIFTLGTGQVIKGWDVGVAGMKVGEKRTLAISPEFGYGATGAGGIIPPNATLNFEVELLAINN